MIFETGEDIVELHIDVLTLVIHIRTYVSDVCTFNNQVIVARILSPSIIFLQSRSRARIDETETQYFGTVLVWYGIFRVQLYYSLVFITSIPIRWSYVRTNVPLILFVSTYVRIILNLK